MKNDFFRRMVNVLSQEEFHLLLVAVRRRRDSELVIRASHFLSDIPPEIRRDIKQGVSVATMVPKIRDHLKSLGCPASDANLLVARKVYQLCQGSI